MSQMTGDEIIVVTNYDQVHRVHATTGAVTDISNQGYGLMAGILAAKMDVIPDTLNLKLGAAVARDEPPPLTATATSALTSL